MKILVACEESQAVAVALRQRGHEAYSCDLIPCSGGHPEWRIQQDVGSYGHWNKRYWKLPGAVEKEAFAHMYEAQFSADKYALMQKYFPTALAEFEKLLNGVV